MIIHVGLLIAGVAAAAPQNGKLERYEETQAHMGTSFTISLYAPSEDLAEEGFRHAFARIEQLNGIMSDYDPQSELSRLSTSAPQASRDQPGPKVKLSDDLWRVLQHAQRLSKESEGAFDVTVGPLTKLWRRARRQQTFPPRERLQEALLATGYRHLLLYECGRTAQLARPGMRLDLGGIAKGYAADEALRVLRQKGICRAIVNGGGDMAVGDPPPDEAGWKVGVAPLEPNAPPSRFLCLANCGIATSGDAWQYVEIDGKRYSHIVDPHTGLGLTQRSGVCVLADNGMAADALASAVSVLGHEKGIQLVQREQHAAALVVVVVDGAVKQYKSPRFDAFDRCR